MFKLVRIGLELWGCLLAYQDKKGLYWAKDLSKHGDSAFKVFKKVNNELHWIHDADQYGNFIYGKHKSLIGLVIKL